MARLLALQPSAPARFSAQLVVHLPDAARRYLRFTIREGTPLHTVALITMTGSFASGDKTAPGYMAMKATQVLAPPEGLSGGWPIVPDSCVSRAPIAPVGPDSS